MLFLNLKHLCQILPLLGTLLLSDLFLVKYVLSHVVLLDHLIHVFLPQFHSQLNTLQMHLFSHCIHLSLRDALLGIFHLLLLLDELYV